MILKQCKCGTTAECEEDLVLFDKDKRLPYGRTNTCIQCAKTIKRRRNMKYRYSITPEEYDECMSSSDSCEICGNTERLCYDHDHTTMEFRGVLCQGCNAGIGLLKDTPEGVLKAYNYLIKSQ